MADDIPADWYPDAQGTIRWWDGKRWTEHVRDSSQAAQGISATAKRVTANDDTGRTSVITNTSVNPSTSTTTSTASAAAIPATPSTSVGTSTSYFPPLAVPSSAQSHDDEDDDDAAHSANRRVWLTATAVGLAAFFLGMGIGGREQPTAPAAEPTTAVSTASADLDQRQQDLNSQQKQLDEREKALDDREQALNDRDAATPTYTPSPTPTPTPSPTDTAEPTATTMGEGTFEVGKDVRSGTYRTSGPSDTDYDCEYTVSNDEAGDDVIQDEQTGSSASVTLTDGEFFTTDYCEDWTRQ